MPEHPWTRRDVLAAAAGVLAVGRWGHAPMNPQELLTRTIPSTGERLPAVGLGTWQQFDVGTAASDRAPLRTVLQRFVDAGARVVDASPMYGRAEEVVGDLAADLQIQPKLFYATKVWTTGREAGIRQMETSFRRMRVRVMDLMQVHNLVDWSTHLRTLRAWKEHGRIRYLGLTHYQASAFPELARLIRTEPLDFVQLNFSIVEREAELELLPLAAEHGVGIIVNRPFEGGTLFRQVRSRELPPWARDFDCTSWGQFFLKYILSAPPVTCVIPGTSNPEHVLDNLGAGRGRLPDPALRARMVRLVQDL